MSKITQDLILYNQYNEKLLSELISFLRFPLIVGVVFIHSKPNLFLEGDPGIYFTSIYRLLSCIISGCSVPLFFFFSGFLFFKDSFSLATYFSKMKKRVKTILIPYILWNLIVFGILLVSQEVSGTSELTRRIDAPIDFLNIFWAYRSGYPMCAQFWFLRDLMMMFLMSPIFYIAIKYIRGWFIAILLTCWTFDLRIDITGFSLQAITFFGIGAYFGITKINFAIASMQNFKFTTALYFCLGCSMFFFDGSRYVAYIHSMTILAGIFAILGLTTFFIKERKWRMNLFLVEASFFIYAYHQVFLGMLTKHTLPFFIKNHMEFGMVLSYIICPMITIGMGLVLLVAMKNYMPLITGILIGHRTKPL